MHRTTIMLPEDLKIAAEKHAHQTGRSLGQLIREALEKDLNPSKSVWGRDSFLTDTRIFEGEVPDDLAAHHDDYLYGNKA